MGVVGALSYQEEGAGLAALQASRCDTSEGRRGQLTEQQQTNHTASSDRLYPLWPPSFPATTSAGSAVATTPSEALLEFDLSLISSLTSLDSVAFNL